MLYEVITNQNFATGGVKLKNPQMLINLEVENDRVYLVSAIHPGLGGYPLSTQEKVLSLISGGFDSGVSSYQFIKRGCRVYFCFFNLGGRALGDVDRFTVCVLPDDRNNFV